MFFVDGPSSSPERGAVPARWDPREGNVGFLGVRCYLKFNRCRMIQAPGPTRTCS